MSFFERNVSSDDCETSLEAYLDVAPLLTKLGAEAGAVPPQSLQLYDPYFCNGGMIQRLKSIGFNNVTNPNSDFYRAVKEDCVPEHDVLISNPPYSKADQTLIP